MDEEIGMVVDNGVRREKASGFIFFRLGFNKKEKNEEVKEKKEKIN